MSVIRCSNGKYKLGEHGKYLYKDREEAEDARRRGIIIKAIKDREIRERIR